MAWTRSQTTFLPAMNRITKRYDTGTAQLPKQVLAPDEAVYAVLVGDTRSDSNPILAVTDRRVLVARLKMVRGWRIRAELPADQVQQAQCEATALSGRLAITARDGSRLTIVSDDRAQAQQVVALLQHLRAGGAPPTF
ncbi:PH domain-containing protein [Dermacoccaceae bacterium W4C1]